MPAKLEVIQQEQLVNPEDQMNPPNMRFSHNNWGPMTIQNAQAFYDNLYHNNFKLWVKSNWTAFFSDVRNMVFKEENLAKYILLEKVADLYDTNCWESSTSRDIIIWQLQNDEKYRKTAARSAVRHLPMAPLDNIEEVDENQDHLLQPPHHSPLPTPPPSPSTGSEEKPVFNAGKVIQILNFLKMRNLTEKLSKLQDSEALQTSSQSPTLADYVDKLCQQTLKDSQKKRMEWEEKTQWTVDGPQNQAYNRAITGGTFDELNQRQFGHNEFIGINPKAFTSQDDDEKQYDDDDLGFEDSTL
ncbi:hypothetical protein VKT23_011336 [Stygiomarasmius scandens]|uniref:Uncharacterized protein n=1 Tax=Marasmiellus scandens TaxID=2682957 RepID=A0ABR1J992_9AGAR